MSTMTTMTLDDLQNLPPLTDKEKQIIKNARPIPDDDCPVQTKEELSEFKPWYEAHADFYKVKKSEKNPTFQS